MDISNLLILAWGPTGTLASSAITVTFAISFSSTNYSVLSGVTDSTSAQGWRSKSRSYGSMTAIRIGQANASGWYLCIGY